MATKVTKDLNANVEICTSYFRQFRLGSGEFRFPCDENGNVDVSSLNPMAQENYRKCISGGQDMGIEKQVHENRLCSCGSGEYPEEVYDARDIYVTSVCDKCRKERLAGYRPEIFSDPTYWHDEPIDPE